MFEKIEVKISMSCNKPLRYKISSWKQLPLCRSNNDRDLKITVTELSCDSALYGFRISVVHPKFGTLFSELLCASGSFITPLEVTNETSAFELSVDYILQELQKFGFIVEYNPREHLPDSMIEYLRTLQGLGFDKLRILNVYEIHMNGVTDYKWYVVGFITCKHKYWLNNNYSASKKEFTNALLQGSAINISEISSAKHFNWSWLDYVANIEDILRDNIIEDNESDEIKVISEEIEVSEEIEAYPCCLNRKEACHYGD